MKKILIVILLALICQNTFAQQNARNGLSYSPFGEIRMFMVFADIVDDTFSRPIPHWPQDSIPEYADEIIDESLQGSLVSYISRYYNEVSFGTLRVIGDYYPYLLKFDSSEISGDGNIQVADYLNNLPDDSIVTHNGHGLSYFDTWTFGSPRSYYPKQQLPDGKIDMLVIVWRRNSKLRSNRDGGACFSYNCSNQIKNLSGINGYTVIYHDSPSEILRHEFGHALLGGNNYHTGGAGNASGHFLSSVGGYSILSSHNHNLESCNGWDRWRLGWKPTDKAYYISALDINGNEINADIVYDKNQQTRDYILRDFVTFGDAVRIKLPHLRKHNSQVRNQYLWIENHQIKEESIESTNNPPKGIRFNIQVGNDSLTDYFNSSRSNYLVPLSSFGNYDFVYHPDHTYSPNNYRAYAYDSRSNPFEGHHPAMMPAIDYDVDDHIKSKEFIIIRKLFKENILKVDDYTVYGNVYDAFPVKTKIGLSTNPPTTPLMTYKTQNRPIGNTVGNITQNPAQDDNREIWLNGLSIKIIEENSNGDIRIRVCFNDYQIDSNVRWCGPIMLTEDVVLNQARTIDIDYGYTPIRPNNPSIINGEKIFSSPTVFTCLENSYFRQEPFSNVNVKNMSSLVLEKGSLYEIEDNATLNIQPTATLQVKSGATLRVHGAGHIEIKNGAFICIEDGANIELVGELSAINLRHGYQYGQNPSASTTHSNCSSTRLPSYPLAIGSQGHIYEYKNSNLYIQDTTYYGNAYEIGNTIQAGYQVTTEKPYGNVIFENGSNVIIDAENDVRLMPGVNVKRGAVLSVR